MDLEELWQILGKERRSPMVQPIPEDFYQEAAEYIKELEKERRNIKDLRDPRVALLDDEVRSARMKVEQIFDKRVGKIISIAASESGDAAHLKGFTPGEKELFGMLSSTISRARNEFLGPIIGYADDTGMMEKAAESAVQGTTGDNKNKKVDIAVDYKDTEITGSSIYNEYAIVRVLRDIPMFVGNDGRNYAVGKEDVVTLPDGNAKVLTKRGGAIVINMG